MDNSNGKGMVSNRNGKQRQNSRGQPRAINADRTHSFNRLDGYESGQNECDQYCAKREEHDECVKRFFGENIGEGW